MNNTNPLVKRQYTEWVYPEPITDIVAWKSQGNHQLCDPSLHHDLLWPDRSYNPKISILVAGCGTSQAAILAFNNPEATVIGIDLSPTSLEYTAALKKKHNISNLELREMNLYNVASLGKKFDLIYSTGVLHHLPDPQEGLERLRDVLADNGVMCLMLYGKYLRAGVYWIQEALTRLNVEQTPEGIAFTRMLISSVPPWHAVRTYIQTAATDLVSDGGLVDTFLHKQDRAYTIPEVLELVATSDLSFQCWSDNLFYYPEGSIPADHPVFKKVATLPDEEQWAVTELILQQLGAHGFLVRKKTDDETKFRIEYNKPSFLKTVPKLRFGIIAKDEGAFIDFRRVSYNCKIEGAERDLYLAVNGKANIEELIAPHMKYSSEQGEKALQFFKRMGRLGHFTFSLYAQ